MDYSKAIRIARALADISQRELANRIGVDASLISMFESGLRKPSLDTLGKIADAIGLPFHLMALLGTKQKNAQAVRAEEIEQLAIGLTRLLLQRQGGKDHSPRGRKRDRKTEHIEHKSPSIHPKHRRRKAS